MERHFPRSLNEKKIYVFLMKKTIQRVIQGLWLDAVLMTEMPGMCATAYACVLDQALPGVLVLNHISQYRCLDRQMI